MTTRSDLLVPLLLSGLMSSFLAPYLNRIFQQKTHFLLLLIPLILFLFFLYLAFSLPLNGSFFSTTSWIEVLNFDLSFRLDGFSLLFSLLITFFGGVIILYSGHYLGQKQDKGYFYSLLIFFMLSMLGLVLSNHLLILFLFWELTTLSSFLLIGFDHHNDEARKSAWQAIIVTSLGSLAMLAGFILLGEECGSYNVSTILEKHHEIRGSENYSSIIILVLLGAFAKSAQFPFFFWLPAAMRAPTPVSAYLHSVTMVKAGIYLMGRFLPILGHTPEWFYILVIIGIVTMTIGTINALIQTDLKLILAYLTLSSLGLLTILLGIGDTLAVKAFISYLLIHSFYKASLFLIVGTIDHEKGSRHIDQLQGLIKEMPCLSIAALLSLLAVISLPPSFAFIGKEFILKATVHYPYLILLLLINLSMTTYLGLRLIIKIVKRPHSIKKYHEVKGLWIPSLVLSFGVTFAGLFPGWLEWDFIRTSMSSLTHLRYEGEVFEGVKIDQILFLSFLTILIALALFPTQKIMLRGLTKIVDLFSCLSPAKLYKELVSSILKVGKLIEGESLRGYYHRFMIIILVTCISAIIFGLTQAKDEWIMPAYTPLSLYEWGIVGVILISTVSAILMTNLITSVMLLGVLGFSIAIIFVSHGAPDLALTQLFVETLTIILFALIAIKYPDKIKHNFNSFQIKRDFLLSSVIGSLMTILLFSITAKPFNESLSKYYSEHAYSAGKGRNVVNVILIDFRALDTLGEITVLSIAGIGFFALLKLGLRRKPS